MNNLKLMMFAAAGLLTVPTVSQAEIKTATRTKVLGAATTDLAEVSGTPARLRRQNERQPGNEMTAIAFFKDGKSGLMFSMNTELNGTRATHRMQMALVPFSLVQDATGAIAAEANLAGAKYVTNNIGNEYRNANYPAAFPIDGGNAICATYNYQANGTNDTKRYAQCFDATGATVMGQTLLFAKNNDDAYMRQDGEDLVRIGTVNGAERFIFYAGANGNGRDDGWAGVASFKKGADGKYTLTREFDLSVEPQEERSRGRCSVGTDPNTAICTWTAGNNQPQRNGTWLGAIDVTPGKFSGANQQGALLWKMQIGGRKQIEGKTTYSMRAMHTRLPAFAADGTMTNSDMIIWRSGDLQGNNNTNGKGGTYRANQLAVMKVTRTGMEYVTPMTDVAPMLLGLDGTHLSAENAVFGQVGSLQNGLIFSAGSHTGGGYSAQLRAVTWDGTKFADAGSYAIAPHDRHLYPNYTGNNPGNQGRNHANGLMVANPFSTTAGGTSTDAYLMVYSTTGKDEADMTDPRKKLSAYISVLPVAQVTASNQPQPQPQDPNDPAPTPEPDPTTPDGSDASDSTLGGCSTGGGTAGFASFLLIGLATLIRRRR